MPASTTLPIVAALTILGSAMGVSLGRSAIAEIDPAYFHDPEVPFHADLAANRGTDFAQVDSIAYPESPPVEGLGTGCIGCRAAPAVYAPAVVSYADGAEDGWSASAPAVRAGPADAVVYEEEPAADPEMERLQRYASYRVSQDEPEASPLEDGAEEGDAGTQ